MASERRVAHFGLASAGLVLVTTMTILIQGSAGGTAVVGQEPAARPGSTATAQRQDATRQASARSAVNIAVMQK